MCGFVLCQIATPITVITENETGVGREENSRFLPVPDLANVVRRCPVELYDAKLMRVTSLGSRALRRSRIRDFVTLATPTLLTLDKNKKTHVFFVYVLA